MQRRTKIAIWAAALAAPFIFGYAWWRYEFPYGFSHCCDLGLYGDLRDYAMMHDGNFPKGEATPEASSTARRGVWGIPLRP
jgi:hypothetical protein